MKAPSRNATAAVLAAAFPAEAFERPAQHRGGYYGCKLPPGACGCPQDVRHKCENARWVEKQFLNSELG